MDLGLGALVQSVGIDLISVLVCLVAAVAAFAKKKFIDKRRVTLVGVLADGLTVSVVFPFLTLIYASYSPGLSVEDVFAANRELLAIALLLCSAMMVRFVFLPD